MRTKKIKYVNFLLFSVMLLSGFIVSDTRAATRTVDTTSDSNLTACTADANDCSLRGAISGAASGDTVNFDTSLTGAIITVGSVIAITQSITISGPGADKLTLSGGGSTRLFDYFGGSNLTLNFSGLTISGGNAVGGHNYFQGGAIEINGGQTNANFDGIVFSDNNSPQLGGVLLFVGNVCRITNSTVINNSAPQGTVIFNPAGSVQITNSTFSGNSGGFGIDYSGPNLIVRNSTIVNNPGGGFYRNGGTLTLANSIVAGNSDYDLDQAAGTIGTNGGNLIGRNTNAGANFSTAGSPNASGDYVGTEASPINPRLTPSGNYGGATPTYALLSNSPALNHGNNCVVTNTCSPALPAALTTDQRGAARQIGSAVDIGSFEQNVAFNQTILPNGCVGVSYNQIVTATRQNSFAEFSDGQSTAESPAAPFTFSVVPVSGEQLPPGLSLSPDGTISGTPTQTGTFTFTVKATDTDGMAGAQQYSVTVTAPTAAGVSVSGRVLTPQGAGLMNAMVVLTDASGNTSIARTSTFGNYHFENVAAGQTYVLTVTSKRYQFAPQVVSVMEDLGELNFTAQ
jgi:Putative Ig domain/Carboxypeptidase regulatory-like domain